MKLPGIVDRKVKVFKQNFSQYIDPQYKEDQLRIEFLNPFFESLNWDISNRSGFAEPYKDVVHEDSIHVEGAKKAPDYCFRIGGYRRFFVEAKKPSVDISEDEASAFQLRRYAWSAKLPVSILTNFRHVAIYDCTKRPNKSDPASKCRLQLISYEEFASKWEFLQKTFSKDAVLSGAFDRFTEHDVGKKGTSKVDESFLEQLREWRSSLARGLARLNPRLNELELNYAVQRILDRIIFLRISEDRGIEPAERLKELLASGGMYKRLCQIFLEADARYNSGLFHFHKRSHRPEPPDEISLKLKLDDEIIRPIIKGLYYPESAFEFSVMPVDIIGQVYEQFLGETIELQSSRRVKISEKLQVRKAGGVFYTPIPVVEMMIQETVLPQIAGKSIDEVSSFKVVDPACGSGTFLIAAFDCLAKHYLVRMTKGGEGKIGRDFERSAGGNVKLTLQCKREILLKHIFGVDLDAQAVETAKLSLMLKLMEDESSETVSRFLEKSKSEALPDLSTNIRHGDSLLDDEALKQQSLDLFPDNAEQFIPFNWGDEFAFKKFDVVIGNPPYGAELSDKRKAVFRSRYGKAATDDTYGHFLQKSCELVKEGGTIGMIVPSGLQTGPEFSQLRRHLVTECDPVFVASMPYSLFDAWVDTTVVIFQRRKEPCKFPRKDNSKIRLVNFPKKFRILSPTIPQEFISEGHCSDWFSEGRDEFIPRVDRETAKVVRKIKSNHVPLGSIADIQRGITPYKLVTSASTRAHQPAFEGKMLRHICVPGRDVYVKIDGSIAEPKPERYFTQPRVLVRELISRQMKLQACVAYDNFVTNKSVQSILPAKDSICIEALCAILNSRALSWYFLMHSAVGQRNDFPKIVLKQTRELPIPAKITKSQESSLRELQLELSRLLTKMHTHGRTPAAQKRVKLLEKKIDNLIYSLFNLSEGEVRTIEATDWLGSGLKDDSSEEVA